MEIERKKILLISALLFFLLLLFVLAKVDVSTNSEKIENKIEENNKEEENTINTDDDSFVDKKSNASVQKEQLFSTVENAVDKVEIKDRSLIRQEGSNDIYIVKIVGQKRFIRLILNPAIFDSYDDLLWEDVIDVSFETFFSYKESNLVMEVDETGQPVDGEVYIIEPYNDNGIKYSLGIKKEDFYKFGYDWDSVYYINNIEAGEDFYVSGEEIFDNQSNKACTQDWLEVTNDILARINVPDNICIEVVSGDSAVGKFILNQGINGFYIIEDNVVAVIGGIGLLTLHAEVHEVCHAQQDWYMTTYYGNGESLDGWINTEMGQEFIDIVKLSKVTLEDKDEWFLPGDSLLASMYEDNNPIEIAAEVCSMALLIEEGVYENKYGYSKEYMENVLNTGTETTLKEWHNKWISQS